MEDVDVQKLSRKELLQLCADHNVRTAGVKQDDLVRLLQTKLRGPARATQKARSQISATNSPVSSPKARNQTNSPFSSPNAKGKPAERPTQGPINPGRSLRPLNLVIQGDRSRNNSPEPSPRTPRKDQVSPDPGALPRKPTTTKSNAPPGQRSSDLLHSKVNTLTAIGKLQAQEKARPGGVGRSASGPPIAKSQQQTDRGAAARTRGSGGVAAPKKSTKGTPAPAKRPGERTKEESRNPSSPRVSEGEASIAATAGTRSDRGSPTVSEIATDSGRHWENSDADDAQSVSSEPVAPRFAAQSERLPSPSTLGHGRRSSLDSNDAPLEKVDADPLQDDDNDDATFNLIGDAHTLDINSFLSAHEINANATSSTHPEPAPESSIPAAEPVVTSRHTDVDSSYKSGEKDDPLSTAECIIERVHFNLDSAPLPHPHMERSSQNVQNASVGEKSDVEKGLSKACFQDGSCTTKSNSVRLQTDGSEKVPLLQQSETGTTLLMRRTNLFPTSFLLWCSQLFYAIFGYRSNQ